MVTPMFVMSNWNNYHLVKNMKEQADEKIERVCSDIIRNLEKCKARYYNDAVIISSSDLLEENKMLRQKSSTYEGIQYLLDVRQMDTMLYELFLLYDEYMYSSRGYCKQETWLSTTLGCDSYYTDLGRAFLASKEMGELLVSSESDKFWIFHYPVKNQYSNKNVSVNYCIKMSEIYVLLEEVLQQLPMTMQISFSNKMQEESIYLRGSEEGGFQEVDKESYDKLINKKSWESKSINSDLLEMELIVSYDASGLYEQVRLWDTINRIMTVFFIFLSILISYKVSWKYYRNVYHIKEELNYLWKKNESTVHDSIKDDFDCIKIMIDDIRTETKRMNDEAVQIQQMTKKQIAMSLFYNGIREKKNIEMALQLCGVEIQESCLTVACFICNAENNQISKEMFELLENNLYCTVSFGDCEILIVLFELPDLDFMKIHRNSIAEKFIKKSGKASCVKVAFSQVFENITRIADAYLEAMSICKQLFCCKELSVAYIDDILKTVEMENINSQKISINQIVNYIDNNYHRHDLSLEEVAKYAGLSKEYLSRLFKDKVGCKYIDYVTKCRMLHARKLIEESDLNIKEISERVGFYNNTEFRSKYKEYYGVTPSEDRINYRNK